MTNKLDRPGANYLISCNVHKDQEYVGETERAMKCRGYEHGIISHKDMKRNHSIDIQKEDNIIEEDNMGTRRSSRLHGKERKDYKRMNEGEEIQIIGNTEVALHMREEGHRKEEMTLKILRYEENWWKRGVHEAIDIKRHNPQLNQDKGRYNLASIWDVLIRSEENTATQNRTPTVEVAANPTNFFIAEDDQLNSGRN